MLGCDRKANRVTNRAVTLRDADPADAEAIARVHARSREEAYASFMSPERLHRHTQAWREARWHRFLTEPDYGQARFLVLAETDAEIVGFAAAEPARHGDPGYPVAIRSLYLRRAFHGHGHGRRLLEAAVERLVQTGATAVIVWTQETNEMARGFYEHLGGIYVRTRPSSPGPDAIPTVGYGWPDARSILM